MPFQIDEKPFSFVMDQLSYDDDGKKISLEIYHRSGTFDTIDYVVLTMTGNVLTKIIFSVSKL